jgi:hypothetical protein
LYDHASTRHHREIPDALSARKEFPAEKVEQLRTLFAAGKKPKADNFAAIFAKPAGGDLP